MTEEPTVFVVDDDPALRDSLRFLLESSGQRVECFDSAEAFLNGPDLRRPGCIVLDVRMPGMSGIELLEMLSQRRLRPPVVIITGHGDIPMAVRALKAGAFDFIEKPFSDDFLISRIRLALRKDQDERAGALLATEIEERYATLTPRERQVFARVVSGLPNKVIASEFGLAQKTVEVHRAHVMEKMRAESFADLVKMAIAIEKTGGPRSRSES